MFVLDCSVTLAWCLPDEEDHYAGRVLNLLIEQQAIVPPLWHLEVMNVLLIAQRKKQISEQQVSHILQTISPLNITTYNKHPLINNHELLLFSQQHQVTSYDATYLYLAQSENLPLATLDKKMRSAAEQLGVCLEV